MRYPAVIITVIVLSLLILTSANSSFDSTGNWQWQILTNRNFSSEIRLHPRILLMVTIPWSGEARSLMKQLGKLVADQPEKHGHLRLMVVYKNFQKMIADVLGAAEEITLYYYHQSTSYKYRGRFVAEKILYSLNYFMSLQSEEVPLKPLNTKNELEYFLNSTDKAVLLIELCGWSSQLFHQRIVKKFTSSAQLYSENDEILRASFFEVDERLPFNKKKNQKGLENAGLSCGFENDLTDSHLSGGFCWANRSSLEEMEYEAADMNLSCIDEEFKQFKSFFSKFKLLARDFFLSPERIRFGLISERSLLPYVGVNTRGAWLVSLQFNGCPSCSMIIETIDDLKNILQEPYSPVMQLELDGHTPEPAFPVSRPSIVLFIDRLSDSPLIREKSKSALEVVRKLAGYSQLFYRMNKGAHHGHSQSPTTQIDSESRGTVISDLPLLSFIKDSSSPKLVKIKDTMKIVISKDQSILSDQSASYTQGNAVYDALLDFIKKRNLVRKKQTKVSLLAKEIGFQLLSDDFEVQVADSSSYYEEHNQLSSTNKQKVLRTEDQTSKLHQEPSEDFVNQNDDLLAKVDEPVIGDGMQAALEDVVDNIPKYREIAIHVNSNTNEDDKSWAQNDMGSLICHDENLLQGTCMEKDSIDASGCSSSFKGAEEKVTLVDPSEGFARDGWAQVEETVMNTDDPTFKLHQEVGEDSVNQNEHKLIGTGGQTFKLHLQPIEDSVNQNDDLLFSMEDHVVDDCKQAALEDAKDDVQKYQQTATEEDSNTNEDNKSCEKNDMGSLICHDENPLLEREVHSVGICMEKDTVDAFGCKSSSDGTEKLSVGVSENFAGGDTVQAEENIMNKQSKEHNEHQPFQCSVFFIDGGYRLLNSLTGGSNIPSLVLLDPVEQHHYLFNEDREIDYSSLIFFVEKFLNGSLSPYQPSTSSIMSAKEAPRPPFVNLDFHEVDAIPQVTTNTFCDMVFGFKPCVTEIARPVSQVQHLGAAWKKDALVLFGLSSCGFCQRMELLVREVFRAFKTLETMLKCESNVINPMCFQDNMGDMVEYSLPSIFLMDCVQNDCGSFLKEVGRNEHYPQLLLYSAQNKSAIPYEGDMLVVNILKFLASEGRNSQYLNKHKGYLWKNTNSKRNPAPQDSSPLTMPRVVSLEKRGHVIVSGSVLSATDKLREAIPFDNSTILITVVEEGQKAFQGIIINKPMRWSTIFDDSDKDLEAVKKAPLFYGGPVRAVGLPLISLARNPTPGYTKVIPGAYFGNPTITRMAIEGIKSGDRSADEYWFFVGYCSWKGDQIFNELAQGAWHLSAGSIGRLDWPES